MSKTSRTAKTPKPASTTKTTSTAKSKSTTKASRAVQAEQGVNNSVAGHLDYIEDGYAYGWALNPSTPLDRVYVDILCDGEVVGHGLADQFRQDLLDAGIGDGNHMFAVKLSYELYDAQPHTLTARNASNHLILSGPTKTFGPSSNPLPYPLIRRAEGLELLSVNFKRISGRLSNEQMVNITKAYQIGCRLQETSQYSEARYVWESIIKLTGPDAFLICKTAETHLLEDQFSLALSTYKKAAETDLLFGWAHLGIATCHRLLGNTCEAEDATDFAAGLSDQCESLKSHIKTAISLLLPIKVDRLNQADKLDESIQLLTRHLLDDPGNTYAVEKLGSIFAQRLPHAGSERTQQILVSHQIAVSLLESTLNTCI
ncbi:hypothetical protein ACOKS3_00960 [Pseudomonas sp. HS6-2]|uniref:hypothetical protein n=1 Tax=Pseudomonas sp. HS6-2 TaxID=3410986 RepID=UPI003BBEA16D